MRMGKIRLHWPGAQTHALSLTTKVLLCPRTEADKGLKSSSVVLRFSPYKGAAQTVRFQDFSQIAVGRAPDDIDFVLKDQGENEFLLMNSGDRAVFVKIAGCSTTVFPSDEHHFNVGEGQEHIIEFNISGDPKDIKISLIAKPLAATVRPAIISPITLSEITVRPAIVFPESGLRKTMALPPQQILQAAKTGKELALRKENYVRKVGWIISFPKEIMIPICIAIVSIPLLSVTLETFFGSYLRFVLLEGMFFSVGTGFLASLSSVLAIGGYRLAIDAVARWKAENILMKAVDDLTAEQIHVGLQYVKKTYTRGEAEDLADLMALKCGNKIFCLADTFPDHYMISKDDYGEDYLKIL